MIQPARSQNSQQTEFAAQAVRGEPPALPQNAASLFDLDLPDLAALLESWGEPTYRARQVWQGLYQRFWNSPDEFTPLPTALRHKLSAQFPQPLSLAPIDTLKSSDGETVKTLFQLADGHLIEAVLMRYEKRRTLCISTQAGCAMGCVFCATGQMGFRRHLSSGEIVAQVWYFARKMYADGEKVTNVVIMGMGEPFHNYDATLAAIDRLNHPEGMALGERRFTISTVGLAPMIQRFAREKRQINLAVSLHAADDALRSAMLPVNRKYPLDVLMAACRDYIQATHRRVTFEWALIRDINDSPEQAHKLIERLHTLTVASSASPLVHVNIIPLNPTQSYPGQATTRQRAVAFRDQLEGGGIPCSIRLRRGIDIQAGCGQLAGRQT